jgi:uncharacterized protein
LEIDTYGDSAWISVVAFRVCGERFRFLPPMPGISSYLQLNLRTYVSYDGEPGVYFFSCDVSRWLNAMGARLLFHLPYLPARLQLTPQGDNTLLTCNRSASFAPAARFQASMRTVSPSFHAAPGTLAHWLTSRYSQYLAHRGALYRGDIRHKPWPLQQAEGSIDENTLPAAIQLPALAGSPLCHFATAVTAHIWPFIRLKTGPTQT